MKEVILSKKLYLKLIKTCYESGRIGTPLEEVLARVSGKPHIF